LRGPQWVKDSFMKAYREEYKQKAFILNNTLLSPAGLTNILARLGGLCAVVLHTLVRCGLLALA
jgi:hypothetical protein